MLKFPLLQALGRPQSIETIRKHLDGCGRKEDGWRILPGGIGYYPYHPCVLYIYLYLVVSNGKIW